MQVKTFEGFSMRDAIRAVRAEFGPDAVILGSKESPLEDGKGKVVQITAARAGESHLVGGTAAYTGTDDGLLALKKQLDGMDNRLRGFSEAFVTKDQVHSLEASVQEVKILLLEVLRGKNGSAFKGLSKPLEDICQQLKVTGLDESRLAELLKHLKALPPPTDEAGNLEEARDYYHNHAIRWMLKRLKIAPRWSTVDGAPSIQVLVGTTGSGKTSAVAKLAALHHLKEKKKVLVVSYDNLRLAATEQLRVFAKVIGVPFESVNDLSEIEKVIGRYPDVDHILLDTSGRSPKNPQAITSLASLKKLSLPVDFHLVLALTETEQHLDRVVRAFSQLGIQSLLFTKLDETWSYGQIFNLSSRWSLPLSYFGVGQRVPEDIERSTRERVVERIFGL